MNEKAVWLYENGEPYAGGWFEAEGRSAFYRLSLAQRRMWERMDLPEYDGGPLYPCGRLYARDYAARPDYSFTFALWREKLPAEQAAWLDEMPTVRFPATPHTVGGAGYTHSMPNYRRVLAEGLDGYEKRVRALEAGDFREGLLELIEGARSLRTRCLSLLREKNAPSALISALERVPFQPSRTIEEALVAWNFTYYMDGCDNPGPLDAGLRPYWRGEDVTDTLRAMFRSVDVNNGWSGALGPVCDGLTIQCLNAIHGLRRPSLELRVAPDMPDEVWRAAEAAIASGCGSPALYNEPLYQKALSERFPEIPQADRLRFNGGGCTETMLDGISCVGSLDAGVNVPLVLSEALRERLHDCATFEEFYGAFLARLTDAVDDTLAKVNAFRRERAEKRPQPVRTLLVDDCVEKGLDFFAGGARYYWSVVNVAGLVNAIDSLLAVRELVYGGEYAPADFLSALDGQSEAFRARLLKCKCFGVDDAQADDMAARFASDVFALFDRATPYLGGRFLPSSIQFTTYVDAGRAVPATPDGRAAGAPLADSIGPLSGKDMKGPTAMLRSVTSLPLSRAVGTPVLNVRLRREFASASLRALAITFFELGGMQMQVTCVSREELTDALAHPEAHRSMIVRVGGYAEYWGNLSPDLRRTIAERAEL